MKERYVVLRNLAPKARDDRGDVHRGEPGATGDVQLAVEGVAIDARDADALRHDDAVTAVARAMPMRLIEPRNASARTAAEAGDIAWGVRAVAADACPYDGRGVKVAVLDTGIEASHPAFAGVRMTIKDFTGTGDGDSDPEGHGTHCAATIFGRAVDGVRIGIAPGIGHALIGKVLAGTRGCTSEEITTAIQWAADNDASIISMSLGIDFPGFVRALVEQDKMPIDLATSLALESYRDNVRLFESLAALIRAKSRRPLLVSAAGNESRRDIDATYEIAVSPPAVAEGIVSVAAVGPGPNGWRIADFSNTGATVCAPGVDIVSAAAKGGLASMSGTSMAAPHVVGVAALWAQKLLKDGMPVDGAILSAKISGRATLEGLAAGFKPRAVGQGLVQAPR